LKDVTEILVVCQEDQRALHGKAQNIGIWCVLARNVLETDDFESSPAEEAYSRSVNAVIGEDQTLGISSTT
jgi:hypothetical protein